MLNNNRQYLFCETPPLKTKGFGFSVLLYHLTNTKKNQIEAFFTLRYYKNLSSSDFDQSNYPIILLDNFIPNFIYKKIPSILLDFAQASFFYLNLLRIAFTLAKKTSYPITICVGANARPIFYSYLLSKFIKNAINVYIVDDFETISSKNKWSIANKLGIKLFPFMMNKYNEIYVISKGLGRVYNKKFSRDCIVIHPKFSEVENVVITQKKDKTFNFVFSGGLSRLYNDTLLLFAKTLSTLNSNQNKYVYKLVIQTYSSIDDYNKINFPQSVTEYTTSKTRDSNIGSYSRADCFIIPYSFEESEKKLVSTSFPQKIAELIQLKRPLLYIGPDYGSVSVFFHENQLNYTLNTLSEEKISEIVLNISNVSNTDYLTSYAEVYKKYFNPKTALH